jgi:hypothetical protein
MRPGVWHIKYIKNISTILLSIDGLAALTNTTPTSDESQKDAKGII